ncbi:MULTISPECIES: hypothetical protein [unclassified Streptomyces]|uniref:hypothetical protein n=1 Tax=unclassified Streptomyces TaxID=2593676 RepID=UPI002DD86A9B|nr:hypothetical protein [Streptomyces sp. NBC_01750]
MSAAIAGRSSKSAVFTMPRLRHDNRRPVIRLCRRGIERSHVGGFAITWKYG